MKKTIILMTVLMIIILFAGFNITRNALTSSINNRMDSSEALIINEINGRLYRDFSKNTNPQNIEYSPTNLSYTNEEGDRVTVSNKGEFTEININYENGTKWIGQAKGNIEVAEIEEVEVRESGGEIIKVNLYNTKSRLYSVTYRVHEDYNKKRVSLNREFTSYFSVVDE